MFDVKASTNLEIKGFTCGADGPNVFPLYIYYKKGSYAGFESDPNAWEKAFSGYMIWVNTASPNALVLLNFPVKISSGETFAFYIVAQSGGRLIQVSGNEGSVAASNSDFSIFYGKSVQDSFGAQISGRRFTGIIEYATLQNNISNPPLQAPQLTVFGRLKRVARWEVEVFQGSAPHADFVEITYRRKTQSGDGRKITKRAVVNDAGIWKTAAKIYEPKTNVSVVAKTNSGEKSRVINIQIKKSANELD